MAVLTSDELAELRRDCARSAEQGGLPVDYTKSIINAALQAVEDFMEATAKPGAAVAINNATAPFVFSAGQKKRLVAYWFRQKFRREGV